jgi:hypothetical protein
MREFTQVIDERYFNLLWRALSERESEMACSIDQDPDSDESALMSNDLVYLRLCKRDLEDSAKKAGFSASAFSLDDGCVDLSEL